MSDTCELKTLARPCPSCPWRLDQGAKDIPGFDMVKAVRLAHCSPDKRGFGPSFDKPLFSCHKSVEGEDIPCAGWLASVGHRHPRVRLAVSLGRLSVTALQPGHGWPALHASYHEVLDKLQQPHPTASIKTKL